jgi:hypothetical protein
MTKIKLPNPVTFIIASACCFWISAIINPAFDPIGVLMLFLCLVVLIELMYPQDHNDSYQKAVTAFIKQTNEQRLAAKNMAPSEPHSKSRKK